MQEALSCAKILHQYLKTVALQHPLFRYCFQVGALFGTRCKGANEFAPNKRPRSSREQTDSSSFIEINELSITFSVIQNLLGHIGEQS